ncbi:hypothetical protein [Promicromonospora soli]
MAIANADDFAARTQYDVLKRPVKQFQPCDPADSRYNDAYEYDDLGAQTARTLTSADGSANRTMTWSYFPDGKLRSKSDDGVPVGSHSVVTDNDTASLAEATGTWATASVAGEQGTDHRTHAAPDLCQLVRAVLSS